MAHARLEPGFCGAHVMKRRKSRAKRLPPPARHLKRLSRVKRCRAPFIKRSRSPGPLMSKLSVISVSPMPTSKLLFELRSCLPHLRCRRKRHELMQKCSILAPIDGTVLRVFARRGESFSTVTPRPLFSIADTSSRHIKAEIDERDVDKVSIGQKVVIRADALEGKRLNGSVVRISAMMGRKSISTGDPSDKSDRDILEAVIGLEDNTRSLPIGLRVTVQFLTADPLKK